MADLTLVVSATLAGFIIGKQGATLKRLQHEYGVKIQLSQTPSGVPPVRTVRLMGAVLAVKSAVSAVQDVLCAAAPNPSAAATRTTTRLFVPHAGAAKMLIGASGHELQRLEQVSGADIEAMPPPATLAAAVAPAGRREGSRLLVVAGSAAQVTAAVHAIVDRLSSREKQRHATFLSAWPFETAFDDHFETPQRAYEDVLPVLKRLAKRRKTPPSDPSLDSHPKRRRVAAESSHSALQQLIIYDPYFCAGATRVALTAMGCEDECIRHENRDFYADIAAGSVPSHDVLLTNPPYSADHKVRLLNFLSERSERAIPFLLLMPAWVAATDYWQAFVRGLAEAASRGCAMGSGSGSADIDAERRAGIFFVSPCAPYVFVHPQAKRANKGLPCVWFCGGFGRDTKACINSLKERRHGGPNKPQQERVEVFRRASMLQRRGLFVAGLAAKRDHDSGSK